MKPFPWIIFIHFRNSSSYMDTIASLYSVLSARCSRHSWTIVAGNTHCSSYRAALQSNWTHSYQRSVWLCLLSSCLSARRTWNCQGDRKTKDEKSKKGCEWEKWVGKGETGDENEQDKESRKRELEERAHLCGTHIRPANSTLSFTVS